MGNVRIRNNKQKKTHIFCIKKYSICEMEMVATATAFIAAERKFWYTVTLVVECVGWVDLDFACSTTGELPKSLLQISPLTMTPRLE